MEHMSWNKLFEQEYLPSLLAQDDTTDPVTGLSKQHAKTAQEWVEVTIVGSKKGKNASELENSFLEDDNEKKEEMLRPASLPVVPSAEEYREKSTKTSNKKEKKEEAKEKRTAKYSNLTHHNNGNSLVFLHPDFKLGVKHGDSSRMKFPMIEFLESDLRVKKVKNGKSMVNLDDPNAGDGELFPTLYIKRNMSLGIEPAKKSLARSKSEDNLSISRNDNTDTRYKKEEEDDLDARLEGQLRDEFLCMMEIKMTNLDKELQQRRDMREEAYRSKEILLKAAEALQQKPSNNYDANHENIWNKAKKDASNDPKMLPARLNLYLQIIEYVEKNGGIRTEIEEQIVLLIKEELEQGHPADKSILRRVLQEHVMSIVHDPELREMIKFIAQLVNVSPMEITQMFDLYERHNLLKNQPYQNQKQQDALSKQAINDIHPQFGNIFPHISSYDESSTRLAAVQRTTSYFASTTKKLNEKHMPRIKSLGHNDDSQAMAPLKSLDKVTRVSSMPRFKSFQHPHSKIQRVASQLH